MKGLSITYKGNILKYIWRYEYKNGVEGLTERHNGISINL